MDLFQFFRDLQGNISTNKQINNVLCKSGIPQRIYEFMIYRYNRRFPSESMKKAMAFYNENIEKIALVSNCFSDTESKNVYESKWRWLMSHDSGILDYLHPSDEKYFCFMQFDYTNVLDVGACCGDTFQRFVRIAGKEY